LEELSNGKGKMAEASEEGQGPHRAVQPMMMTVSISQHGSELQVHTVHHQYYHLHMAEQISWMLLPQKMAPSPDDAGSGQLLTKSQNSLPLQNTINTTVTQVKKCFYKMFVSNMLIHLHTSPPDLSNVDFNCI
jgi:hypothetical protein